MSQNSDIPKSRPESEVHSELDWTHGGVKDPSKMNSATIDPPGDFPANKGLRYKLNPWTLGKLETLAKSRFLISDFVLMSDLDWSKGRDHTIEAIAQSVLASNEIEGETVYVRDAEVQGAIQTTIEDGEATADWEKRRRNGQDMYDAYIFALNSKNEELLSVEFILDLHRRMFSKVYPDTAGITKREPVVISGRIYNIKTASPKRTKTLFEAIIFEFNRKHQLAQDHSEFCTILLIAEFLVDFLAIHPFEDGNGRMARLLSTYLLEKTGYHFARFYSLDNIIQETKSDYYQALYGAQKSWFKQDEDMTEWVEYYIEIVYKQWRRAHEYLKDRKVKDDR